MWMVSPPVGVFQSTKKLFLSERAGRGRTLEFIRKKRRQRALRGQSGGRALLHPLQPQ
ncbi:unnamed protein product [Bubo scandiacus]